MWVPPLRSILTADLISELMFDKKMSLHVSLLKKMHLSKLFKGSRYVLQTRLVLSYEPSGVNNHQQTNTSSSISPNPNPRSFPKSTNNLQVTNNHTNKNNLRQSISKSNSTFDPTILWTSLIAQKCRSGHFADAAAVFTPMRTAGVELNHVTFITLLSCCAQFPSHTITFGACHALVRKLGMDICNVKVGTVIVDMYVGKNVKM